MAKIPPLRNLRKTTIFVIVVFLGFLIHRIVVAYMGDYSVRDYAEAELNKAIPPDLYEAVAEVMVYLYKLGRIQA